MDGSVSGIGASQGMSAVLGRIASIQSQISALAPTATSSAATPTGSRGSALTPTSANGGFSAALTSAVAADADSAGTMPAATGGPVTAAANLVAAGAATASWVDQALLVAPSAVRAAVTNVTAATTAVPVLTTTPLEKADRWRLPVDGRLTSPFGMRTHPVTGVYKLHTGADFAAATGTPIGAARAGVVRSAGWQNGNGNTVVIDHGNGVSTLYGHASELLVKPGQRVAAGEAVAKAGSTGYATGPHLHLEVRKEDKPIDPLPWLRRHGVKV